MKFMSATEVATVLGCSVAQVYRILDANLLPERRMGYRRFIPSDAVDEFVRLYGKQTSIPILQYLADIQNQIE